MESTIPPRNATSCDTLSRRVHVAPDCQHNAATDNKRTRPGRTDIAPLEHTWSTLACAFMSTCLVILIIIYCSDSDQLIGKLNMALESSSRAIFVLSVLSGGNGIFLTATIASSVEIHQLLLVSRFKGISLRNFLILDAGTGVGGLIKAFFGRGLSLFHKSRLWSFVRLAFLAVVPFLGVLIMSDVNTKMQFSHINSGPPVMGWGMKPFNGSLAAYTTVVSSQIINGLVLGDTGYAMEISNPADRAVPCVNGPLNPASTRCRRSYVIPGGIDNALRLFANSSSKSDYFLAENQQSLVLDFLEGEQSWIFDENECGTYGFPFGGFRLCLRNETESSLKARILGCPPDVSANGSCFTNATWHQDPGWQTSLDVSFVNASVAYSRHNGTILSYQPVSSLRPATVPGKEILTALRSAFGDFSGGLESLIPILTQPDRLMLLPMDAYPLYIWGFLEGSKKLAPNDPEFVGRGHDTLASLLAMIMYFGQPSVYAQALMSMKLTKGHSITNTSVIQALSAELAVSAPPDVPIYMANLYYRISISQPLLITYIALSGFTLVVCLCLVYGISVPSGAKLPPLTPYPALNFYKHAVVDATIPPDLESLRRLEEGHH